MSLLNLDKIFEPQRVAVVGAGTAESSVGHVALRNMVDSGFEGVVYPINPTRESVGGIQAYASIAETPATPDLAIVCTPAATVPDIVRSCGEAGVKGLVILSAGFRETGEEGRALERRVGEEAASFEGLRILGPNCLGLLVPRLGLNASFASSMPIDGTVAFVSQSGALATAMIDWATAQGIGFSHVVSLGNMLDVDLADLIDYLGADSGTRSIVIYLETVTQPRKFLSAARAFARSKPIVAYKAGRFPASAKAAVSHTGAMAGEDTVFDAAFERAGIVRVERIADVFATAELLARERPPRGPRLSIVTNAGGPGVMAADALLEGGGVLADLSEQTLRRLDDALPESWSSGNPVDVLGDATPERFADSVETVAQDEGTDATLVILTPQAMTDATATATAVAKVRGASQKPLLAAWMGGRSVELGISRLERAGVATFTYPEEAVGAFLHLVTYAHNLETLYEIPRAIPVSFKLDRMRVRDLMGAVLSEGREVLSETSSKTLLDAYEIPTTKPLPAASAKDAAAVADSIGYPVVLKVRAPDITHKTDVGGVAVGIASAPDVRAAFDRIVASVGERRPDAEVQGVTVQPMVSTPGHELILGARRDATFGAVIMVGAGGVAAELLDDTALGLPPLNERLARRMLESLRIWPLLVGHRGRPGVDLDRLLEVLIRFSYLVADYPEIVEIEVNPLLVTQDGAVALDARAVVDQSLVGRRPARFSHLSIRPYPEEYTAAKVTSDGLHTVLRPIKPEDEPLWHEMLNACSPESVHSRFRGFVKHASHEVGARFCFTDYDRELGIVAEVEEDGARRLAGVGRLVSDPDHREAEYALLVADPWQGRGLSDEITAYCLEIAGPWGVDSVYAETTPDNTRMIAVLKNNGFDIESRQVEGTVVGTRRIEPVGKGGEQTR